MLGFLLDVWPLVSDVGIASAAVPKPIVFRKLRLSIRILSLSLCDTVMRKLGRRAGFHVLLNMSVTIHISSVALLSIIFVTATDQFDGSNDRSSFICTNV